MHISVVRVYTYTIIMLTALTSGIVRITRVYIAPLALTFEIAEYISFMFNYPLSLSLSLSLRKLVWLVRAIYFLPCVDTYLTTLLLLSILFDRSCSLRRYLSVSKFNLSTRIHYRKNFKGF